MPMARFNSESSRKSYKYLQYRNIQMKNFEPKKSEEQQLQEILNETFTNTDYCDEDIGQFINDPSGNYQEMFTKNDKKQRRDTNLSSISLRSKGSKASSRKHSEQANQDKPYAQSFDDMEDSLYKSNHDENYKGQGFQVMSDEDRNSSVSASEPQKFSDNTQAEPIPAPQQYRKLSNYYKSRKSPHSLAEVKQKYPYFIVSQPTYSISKTYHENTFQYNTIKNLNIQCIDVGYCNIVENFKIAIGSDDGRVALFERTYTKPVNIFEAFNNKSKNRNKNERGEEIRCKVVAIKWSENLQYLAVASNRNELKVYQFKQSIMIQDKNILRSLKEPIQIISLGPKQLKKSIINLKFVSELPFILLLNDQDDDMQLLEYKVHIMNYRPYLSKLAIKFNDVYQVQVIDFVVGAHRNPNKAKKKQINMFNGEQFGGLAATVQKSSKNTNNQQYGTLLAVSSDQYVTIALLRPYFEVIMVYDKEKHGKNIKKQGYAHINFRKDPLGLLIVWDKFAQLLSIEVDSLSPLQTRIRNIGSQLMPQTTLQAGLITDTLVYQLSESGIKIYACANFGQEKEATKFKECIYEHAINFYELPLGLQIQEELVQKFPNLTVLNLLKAFIKTCNDQLFITTNTSLFSVRIEKFEEFVRTTIENINNWKIGLQLIHDAYKDKYRNYDNMTRDVILRNLYEYTTKYINFLMMVIGNTGEVDNSNEQMLWRQETTFLFNILIETEQYEHLFNKILPKLVANKLSQYVSTLEPFILLHKLHQITSAGLELLYSHLSKQVISILLIANINPEENEVDLPHMINQIIVQHSMFHQMVSVNLQFGDYFTPFVVLASHYEAVDSSKLNGHNSIKNDIQLLTELKMRNKDSDLSEESKVQPPPQNPEKQSLRQIIVYLTYNILHKINTNEDCSTNLTNQEYKKIQMQHKQFLATFLPLFQTSIINILLDSPQHELSLFESILPELFTGQCLQIINDISNKQFNTDLMTDIAMGIPISRVKSVKTYWICLIRLYNRSVIKMEIFMGLRYLIEVQRKEIEHQMNESRMKEKGRVESMLEASKIKRIRNKGSGIQKFIKETVAMSEYKISQEFSKLSPELLEQFYNQLLRSPSNHIGLLKIVAIILGSGFYIKVILAMMVQKKSSLPNKFKSFSNSGIISPYTVYDFIEETIGKFSKKERQQLKIIIYENVEVFIQKDCDKLCNLIIDHYLQDIDKFVTYNTNSNLSNRKSYTGIIIGESPIRENSPSISVNHYQLINLIEGLLHRLQSAEIQNMKIDKFQPHSEWMLELRLKFLKLLALTGRQHEILSELQKENYPLDSSLQICRNYGVIDAEAYLLVKSGGEGEIASAIRLYFTLVSEKIKFLTPENLPNFKQYFISIIRECIRVCQNLHVAPDHFNEEWFLISEELYQMKIGIYRVLPAYTGDLLCDIIDKEIYPLLTEKIVRKQNSECIVGYLKQNMSQLDLIFIRSLLDEMLRNYAFQKAMFLLVQETYIQSQIRERRRIKIEAEKGFKTEGICNLCREENGILIHYSSCGHQIHPSCGQDVKDCYICSFRPQKMIEKQFDLLKKIRPELYGRQVQDMMQEEQKEKKRKESKMESLKRFDENQVDIFTIEIL